MDLLLLHPSCIHSVNVYGVAPGSQALCPPGHPMEMRRVRPLEWGMSRGKREEGPYTKGRAQERQDTFGIGAPTFRATDEGALAKRCFWQQGLGQAPVQSMVDRETGLAPPWSWDFLPTALSSQRKDVNKIVMGRSTASLPSRNSQWGD